MKKRLSIAGIIMISLLSLSSSGEEWATGMGSCYAKGSMTAFGGVSFLYFGMFAGFDYGFHDCISGGVAIGINGKSDSFFKYRQVPFTVHGAFHPFNLSVLADKIKVRDKLDVYAGLTSGWKFGWSKVSGSNVNISADDFGGFVLRELLGVRFFPTDNFFIMFEERAGFGVFNFGAGYKF